MITRTDLLCHVSILFFDLKINRSLTVFLIHDICDFFQFLLFLCKLVRIVVTHNVDKFCLFAASADFDQMIKSFVPFGLLRCLFLRQHHLDLTSDSSCIDHDAFGTARMHVDPLNLKNSFAGIEIFVFDLAFRTAVHGIGKICCKSLYIKMICPSANLFVRRKCKTDLPMRHITSQNVFCHRHNFCNTCFVICSEDRRSV